MREDTEAHHSKNVGYQLFPKTETADASGKRRDLKNDSEQEKKNKLWESIQKQAEEENDEEDVDSDENQDVPNASHESDGTDDE